MYGDLICGDENKFDFYENNLSVAKEIKKAIANLGCYQDNYVVVNLNNDIEGGEGLAFFQTIHCFNFGKTHLYNVEIRVNVKEAEGITGKMYSVKANKKQTLAIFDVVCVQRQIPDLSQWKDITDIALGKENDEKQKRRKKYGEFYNNYFYKHDHKEEWLPQYKKVSKEAWNDGGGEYTEYLTEDYVAYGKYEIIRDMFAQKSSDPVLSYLMGEIEYYGYLGKPDYKKSFKYYSHSSKRGYLQARCKIALMYKKGVYVQQNYDKYVSLIRSAYWEIVKERGESLAMLCAGYLGLELSKIEQERGNIEKSLDYALDCYLSNKRFIDCSEDLSIIIEAKKQIYAIQPLDSSDMEIFDILYVLQNPSKVRLVVRGRSYYIETLVEDGRKYTKFKDKYYRDAARLFNKGKIVGLPIKEIDKYLDYVEVVE